MTNDISNTGPSQNDKSLRPMTKKTVLITGATSGIGKETAMGLGRQGASLVIVGRDDKKLADVRKAIMDGTGDEDVEVMRCDLSSLKEVRALAKDFQERFDRLDVLINNAGTIIGDRRTTADGYEYTFALDHRSPFLLTNLLLDTLKKSAPARIITVSSVAHKFGRMHFEDLMFEKGYSPMKAYSQAKLANVLFTYELARRLEGQNVTSNCLHPGNVRTNFGQETHGIFRTFLSISSPFLNQRRKRGQDIRLSCILSRGRGSDREIFCQGKSGPFLPQVYGYGRCEEIVGGK